jgi:hypothetical protein
MLNFKESSKGKSKKNKDVKKVSSKVTSVLPFLDIKKDCIIQKDELMDIIEIEGKDILSLTKSELGKDINVFHSLYKTVNIDLKLISMNFPVNTKQQRDYIEYKINKTTKQIYKSFLMDKKNELEYLEKNRTNKEYYLFMYAPNLDILNSAKKSINRTLPSALNIKTLSVEKKKLILHKLNNKNSKIDTRSDFIG